MRSNDNWAFVSARSSSELGRFRCTRHQGKQRREYPQESVRTKRRPDQCRHSGCCEGKLV